jgi:hypothetical protein
MTWLPTTTGRVFDIVRPDWRAIDLMNDVAEQLAQIARFSGAVRAGPYSVGQHSIIGADYIWRETKDERAAAAFLLHDAHEYVLTDKTSPNAEAEVFTAELIQPGSGRVVREMQRLMKLSIDIAIYQAAGMGGEGCPGEYRDLVKAIDLRLLATEKAHLLGPQTKLWHPAVEAAEPLRLTGKITPWPWHKAADEYRVRLRKYLPDRFGPVSPRPQPKPGRASARRRTPVEA